jgi:hypothetical protein
MSKVLVCECREYMVTDVEYLSIRFEPTCPKCGRKWSTFHSEEWPQASLKLPPECETCSYLYRCSYRTPEFCELPLRPER